MPGEPILVVDDNIANQRLIATLLKFHGYEIRVASGGEEMFAILESFRPRLILMDIQMPGTDGLELTRRLRAKPETHGLLIVALSAAAMLGDDTKAREAGCDGYVTKPIDTRGFPALVAGYLERGG